MKIDKEYIGDGVYVKHEEFTIILTTEEGDDLVSNIIYLEPDTLRAFEQYIAKIKQSWTPK